MELKRDDVTIDSYVIKGDMDMNINEVVSQLDKIYNTRIELTGCLYVSAYFSYMIEEPGVIKTRPIWPVIYIPDKNIISYLHKQKAERLVGSSISYVGLCKLVGCIGTCPELPMFSAILGDISEMLFVTNDKIYQTTFLDPPKSIYIKGGIKYSNEQLQTIKYIRGGSYNFIQLRNHLMNTKEYLLDTYLDTEKLNSIIIELKRVKINDYFIEYTGNRDDKDINDTKGEVERIKRIIDSSK